MPACPVGPRENTGTGPADRTGMVIFFTCLDLEQKSSFMDGQELVLPQLDQTISRKFYFRIHGQGHLIIFYGFSFLAHIPII